ncbi:putative PMA1-H+-transporting P-type ATPase [Apiospora saccharicola]|uniref:PMA1-H+-transporting P-type ATPase n=1 Tax=Apiospora saccharicola TaxID=335842 RepID=A0ABR1TIS2_9PEZI
MEARRKPFGWNELTAEEEDMFTQFLDFFQGPVLYAVVLGDWVDFGVIVGILLLKAFVGFYQEKPENAKKEVEKDFDYEHSHYGLPLIICDQSAITGESLTVDKYMGDTTGCKRGEAYAIVITSARCSFVGKTANLVQGTKDQGYFKQVMDSIGTSLLVLVMFWILVAWIGGFFHHIPIAIPGVHTPLHYALVESGTACIGCWALVAGVQLHETDAQRPLGLSTAGSQPSLRACSGSNMLIPRPTTANSLKERMDLLRCPRSIRIKWLRCCSSVARLQL